ncbi:MAG TPA: serine/threonine-protein kinase [Anaerolineae bacterium]|nr:serine/threonine-protein kinase [Anaerolineae bacterium]
MTSAPPIGHQIGKYHVRGLLGEGAMAWVLNAYEAGLDRFVALKVLKPEFNSDTEVVGRFQDEARSAARLRHRHIVAIFESGQTNGWNYIAMDLVKGRSLRQVLDDGRPLSPDRVISILRQVATALDWAHDQRPTPYIHRDIKPENIMVGPGDDVTLVDFGLVRIGTASRRTRQGTVMGTYEYMSPEQVRGDLDVTPATDIWSLGVVAFELLAGRTPFFAENRQSSAITHKVVNEPLPSVRQYDGSLGPAVDKVLLKAMAKHPTQRWSSARELVSALEVAMQRKGGGIAGGSSMEWLRNWRSVLDGVKWPAMGIAAAVLVVWLLVRQNEVVVVAPPSGTATSTVEPVTVEPTASIETEPPVTATVTVDVETTTDTPVPVPTATATPLPRPTDTARPTIVATVTVGSTRIPPTVGPTLVNESISFWQDGPQLSVETVCTSIRWESNGFDHVFVWLEQGEADRGVAKLANGRETNICGIAPGSKATFNLAAVRSSGSEERRVLVVTNDGE